MVEHQAFQPESGGSTPTPSLHTFRVFVANRREIRDFIERHHYSHNINGVKGTFYFSLKQENDLAGAMILGAPATRGVDRHYGGKDCVIEIRRLVCIDDTPRNTESFFIGYVLRWLRKNTPFKTVLAYSDLEHGHQGIVYAASNFKKVGEISGAIKIMWNGKLYHDRSMRVKYKGQLKPFAEKLKTAYLSGQAKTIKTAGKNVWTYSL